MPALTHQDVGFLMRKLNAEYQPPGECAATPAKMRVLLDRLDDYTSEVQLARNKYKALGVAAIALGPAGVAASDLLGGGDVDVAQWREDMTNWQYRLSEYQRVVDAVDSENQDTLKGCREIYSLVTAPLLDGIWYDLVPGIVLSGEEKARMATGKGHPDTDISWRDPVEGDHPEGHSNAKVPDVITPFSLGNQILVYQDFQREKAAKLFEDLTSPPGPDEWPWWLKAALIVGAGTVVGIGSLYAYRLLPKPKPKAKPKAKSTKATGKPKAIKNALSEEMLDKLLNDAAPHREYGENYNRGIDESARWLERARKQKRTSETKTAAQELWVRLEAA